MNARYLFLLACWFLHGHLIADDQKVIVANVTSNERGKIVTLEWTSSVSKLASLPVWKIGVGEFPLSMEEAIKIANTDLVKRYPAVKSWKLEDISLREIGNNGRILPEIVGKYFYLVRIVPAADSDTELIEQSETGDLSFYEVVLSDGTLLKFARKFEGI